MNEEELRQLAMEADLTEPQAIDDNRCWPGTPRYNRRQEQYKAIRKVWAELVGDVLPTNLINTWLKAQERQQPGDECSQIVDCLLAASQNQKDYGKTERIESPRSYYTKAILKQLDPDHGLKQAALKAKAKGDMTQTEFSTAVWDQFGLTLGDIIDRYGIDPHDFQDWEKLLAKVTADQRAAA